MPLDAAFPLAKTLQLCYDDHCLILTRGKGGFLHMGTIRHQAPFPRGAQSINKVDKVRDSKAMTTAFR